MIIPLVWPRAGTSAQNLINALWDVINRSQHVGQGLDYPLGSYVGWVTESARALQPWLNAEDIDRLIRTPTYWAVVGMSPQATTIPRIVSDEMRGRQDGLQRAVESLEQFRRRFDDMEPTTLVIPDTNVLLQHPVELADIDWHSLLQRHVRTFDTVRLVIPLLVVDELDNAKRRRENRTRARTTLRHVYRSTSIDVSSRSLVSERTGNHGAVWLEVLTESPGHERLGRPDDELVSVTGRLGDAVGKPVLFLTYDTGAALRAVAGEVEHVLLQDKD